MEKLEEYISQFVDETISLAVYDLETGEEILIKADEVMHPASTMKVPIMMEVFHQAETGTLTLDDRLKIHNSFTSVFDGSVFSLDLADDSESTLYHRIGQTESVRELVRLMIVRSSNLASNILMDKVGAKIINNFILELGIENMKVIRGLEDKMAYRNGINNSASSRGSTQMLRLIAEGKVLSKSACDEMIQIMFGQEFDESIPRLLPQDVKVAHKTGWAGDYFHDIGIVYPPARMPYIISLFTHGFPEDGESQAHNCMAEISKIIYSELVS